MSATFTYLVFFSRKKGWYGTAMKIVTGGRQHHVGTMSSGWRGEAMFYDLSWQYRRRPWLEVAAKAERDGVTLELIPAPVDVPIEHLDGLTLEAPTKPSAVYSLLDFLSFIPRMFGVVTKNQGGMICSEREAATLIKFGWKHDFRGAWPPSPASLRQAVMEERE